MKISELLNKKWTNLLDNFRNLENNGCPGVYILAYTDKDLEGKSIKIEDIFYVGMTNSRGGLKQRLNQFISGIHKCYGHSAGNRFFQDYSKGKSFAIANHKKKFFVASLSFPCKVHKDERTAEDLRKMGEVAKFEYEVLAYIKENLGREPELNKK
ncbi:MAG: hypothetical protein Q8P15_01410 [Nanoarchaeota archaeon]|nr:hypothetical protein [Nanoarchaeota archaeon]